MKNKKLSILTILLFWFYTPNATPLTRDTVPELKKVYDTLYDSNTKKLNELEQLTSQLAQIKKSGKLKKKKSKQ